MSADLEVRVPRLPAVAVLDVNETLSDLAPLAGRFTDVGAPASLAPQWFAAVLRDGFALTVVGAPQPFAVVAASLLRGLLRGVALDRDLEAAVDHVMTGFTSLPVHADVPDGLRALRSAGCRIVTLSNGATSVADGLLVRAGVRDQVEALLTVEHAGAWKPARAAYEHAAQSCGVDRGDMVLVAVHPWDVDGAARAGLRTAWLSRDGTPYPQHMTAPTWTVRALTDLPAAMTG